MNICETVKLSLKVRLTVYMGTNQLLLTFIVGLTSVCKCTDPCDDYQLLDDETRYIDYTLPFGQTAQCDRSIVEGWYRFQGDRNIPSTAPLPGQCGTDAPIWLQGTYPDTDGDTDTLTACKVGFFDNCSPSWTIDVKNCGVYNVFNLRAISSCEGRYCMGSAVPCPDGTTSDTGFAPCSEETFNLTLTGYLYPYAFIPTFNPYSRERILMFRCGFWFYSNDVDVDSLLYDVRWDIDDTEFSIKQNLNKSEIASKGILKSTEWRNAGKKMGFNLKCSIRSKMEENGTSSKYLESYSEYIGIATWPNSITISSGGYAVVHLYPTVPIACIYNSSYACRLRLELFDFTEQFQGAPMYCNESILELTKPSLCGLELDGWRQWGHTPLNISVPANSAQDQKYTALVKLRSIGLSYDPLWEDYHLPPIKINVVNDNITDDYWYWNYAYCSSAIDPWFSTFDWQFYGFHDEGEFVLFRHKTKPIEVHTIQRRFNASDDWTENCAVAVRAAKDVFIVYGCGRPTQWIIRRLNCDAEAEYLQVYYRWDQYEVHLPTGTIVSFYITMNRRLNVYIYVSRSDRDQVEGLCGNWNGNWTDDFRDRSGNVLQNSTLFARSWRVPSTDSLFVAKRRNETINVSYMYCACSDSTMTNSDLSPNVDCSWQENVPTCPPLNWDREPCQINRKKRSTDDLDDDNEIDVPEDIVAHKEHPEVNDEWKNGWNESTAKDACMTYFEESPSYQACITIGNLNTTEEINTCIINIRISGTREFIADSLDAIVSHCSVELRKNTTLASETDSEGLTIYEKIGKSICPNDCKNNGVKTGDCVEGICLCFPNFTGGDCGINVNSPPILSGVSKESTCDASKRACNQVSMYGTGYFPSNALECRIRKGKITDTHYESISTPYRTTAAYKNKGEVRCPLLSSARRRKRSALSSSDTTLYLVSITSNGIDFSNEVPVVIYDSDCTNCNVTGSIVLCQKREDVCTVDDNCFPSSSSLCPSEEEEKTSQQKLWIVGVVAGIVIAFILGVLVMKCYTKKRFSVFPLQVCGGRNESVYETDNEFMYDKQHSAMEFATAPASTTN